MLKGLFYLVAILFIIYEMGWLLSPVKKSKASLKNTDILKRIGEKEYGDWLEEDKKVIPSIIWAFFVLTWALIGLFSFNWVLFLSFILFNFLIMGIVFKMVRGENYVYYIANWINSLIGLVFALFAILNTYHFKIDLLSLVQNWF